MSLYKLLPQPPTVGPPLPSFLMARWPWIHNPGNPAPIEPPDNPKKEPASTEAGGADDYVLTLRKKQPNPTWLKEYQERLGAASRDAVEKTKHLKGQVRIQAINRIISESLKK